MGEHSSHETLTPKHLGRVFEEVAIDQATLTNANGLSFFARGFGETYWLSRSDGSDLPVIQLTNTPLPGQGRDDTIDFVRKYFPVKEQLYIAGQLAGGVTAEGKFVAYLDRHAPVIELLESAKQKAAALAKEGLRELFWPTIEEHTHESVRRLGNYVLGRLLQHDSSEERESLAWIVDSELSVVRPRFECTLEGKTFNMSYQLACPGRGRSFILLYTDIDKPPTVFYKSNSHGVWRALLALNSSGWHAKGMKGGEHSNDAAIALQRSFATIGSLGACGVRGNYYAAIPGQASSESIVAARERASAVMSDAGVWGVNYGSGRGILSKDRTRLFIDGKRPDLVNTEAVWTAPGPLYGEITYTSCLSRDGSIRYLLCQTIGQNGKVHSWVGSIEFSDAPVSALGIRQHVPALPGMISTPPIDYVYSEEKKGSVRYGRIRTDTTRLEKFICRSLAQRR